MTFADPDLLVYLGCDSKMYSWRAYSYKIATFLSNELDDKLEDSESYFNVRFSNERSSEETIFNVLELSKRT